MSWDLPFTPEPPDWRLDWEVVREHHPWLERLAGCPQSPIYHAEGDVLVHTRMVAEALVERPAWRALDQEERSVLLAAALLHDIAKPECTRMEDGLIKAPGHAAAGARAARRLLLFEEPAWEETPLRTAETVVGLVRFHGLPLFFLERERPERALIEASLRVRLDSLALLAEADARGRVCPDLPDLLGRIDLFRDLARELGCLDRPYPFASDHSRFLYFRKPSADPAFHAFDDTWGEVTLLCGLPSSGKDTYVRKHAGNAPVISLDSLRAELGIRWTDHPGPVVRLAKERARAHLRARQPFFWNATNLTRDLRAPLVQLFTDYGARTRIVYLAAPWREILRRNRTREAQVSEDAILDMARRLEVPDLTEAGRVEWIETA